MVGEITVNPKHEPRAFAVMPFVWSIGTIVGPSIGGYFATPAKNFPDMFTSDGVFARFPYLLPNLICAGMMLASIIAGYFLLEETHPDMQPWSTEADLKHTEAETPLIPAQAGTTTAPANLAQDSSYGTFNKVQVDQAEEWRIRSDGRPGSSGSGTGQKVFTKRVVMLIVALGVFTYHSMTYDHLLPIFFQDERTGDITISSLSNLAGGLGLSIQQVGVIMSINGIIALFVQAVVFPLAAARLGVWRVFVVVTILHPIAYFIVPYLTMLPQHLVLPGIYTCLTIRNLLSILAYPVLLILIKEAAPSPACLGKINGLAASTGAACRTIASPVAGLLYGIGISIDFTAIAWWASALVAIIGAVQIIFMRQRKGPEFHRVTATAPCRFMPEEAAPRKVVHVSVRECEDRDADTDCNERAGLLDV